MLDIREIDYCEKEIINRVVEIHLATFQGFFLSFMGKGFLKQLYYSFCKHSGSGLIVAFLDGEPVGFLAYSEKYSELFKYMIKTRLIPFGWYSLGAMIRKPKVFFKLLRAFSKPRQAEREEKYVELSSIGVDPACKSKGIGSALVDTLKEKVDFSKFSYIALETDAVDNDAAIHFYEKNNFTRINLFETFEGRKMFEYRFPK